MRITLALALLTACGSTSPAPPTVVDTPVAPEEAQPATDPAQVEEPRDDTEGQEVAPDQSTANVDLERVSIGALDVRGSLDPAQLAGPLRGSFDAMRACYDEALTRDPSLAGIVEVTIVINASGGINAAQARTGIEDGLDSCVVRTARALSFPPVTGGGIALVNIPFHFRNR